MRACHSECLLLIVVLTAQLTADDWPTTQRDNRRTGFNTESIDAASLVPRWKWQSPFPPQPAWHGPAKWDAYARIRDLPSMRSYDLVFHTTAVGDSVFFGSSTDDSVYCLSADTGAERWRFTTDGPVRIAPSIANGLVYFGSDDGAVYCLSAGTGELQWKFRPVEPGRKIINNGRFISSWPCRTGVMIDGSLARFACSLLPWSETYLCAVNATTGKPVGPGTSVTKLDGQTLEGAPALSSNLVLFPQGRVAPQVFSREDGRDLGQLKKSGGGSIVVVTVDSKIMHGPATDSRRGGIGSSDPEKLEMVASHGRGSALIVSDSTSYMLADDELVATDLATSKPRFRVPCEYRLSLAGSGNVVFAGGDHAVAAFDAASGEQIWQHDVGGRAYGLSVANGRLLVSTDSGSVIAFGVSSKNAATVSDPVAAVSPLPEASSSNSQPSGSNLPRAKPINDEHLLGHWLFQRSEISGRAIRNLTGGLAGEASAGINLEPLGEISALSFDGTEQSVLIAPSHRNARIPRREISVAAWVRVDEPLQWGGIVGAAQDNGDFERGWMLGFNESHFSFALAGTEGNGRLTYLKAADPFTLKHWQHVVGTFDGAQMQVFVNGELAATSTVQKGDIHYPPQAFYEIGAYHDKDENHRLRGAIHEVRVYNDVLSASEIRTQYEEKRELFPVTKPEIDSALGPWLQFTGGGTGVVRWETDEPSPTRLTLTTQSGMRPHRPENDSNNNSIVYSEPTLKREHRVELSGLGHNQLGHFSIEFLQGRVSVETRKYECDTFFDYTLPASRHSISGGVETKPLHQKIKAQIDNLPSDQGLAVVVGLSDGQSALSLVKHSRFRVVCFDDDESRVASVRKFLRAHYGGRVTVHLVKSLSELPIVGSSVNLVVSERVMNREQSELAFEVARILQPGDGTAVFQEHEYDPTNSFVSRVQQYFGSGARWMTGDPDGIWSGCRREVIAGSGEWTHLYGRPDNSAFGGETLSGARSSNELAVQWLGRPGPRYQSDRSGRKPSPLAVGGRLFLEGLDRIVALDSYNGTVLWSLEVPGFQRFNVARDSSNWCADSKNVFAVVRDRVWQIDAATGEVVQFHSVSPIERENWQTEWSFVARVDQHLIGSSAKAGSAWQEYWGKLGWHDERTGESTHQVCSDRLFARSVEDGSSAWEWANGVILNSSITIANGVVYFVESRHPGIVSSNERRIGRPELWQNQFIVALDANTGSKLWERPIDTVDGTVVFYMAHSVDRLIVVSSAEPKSFVYSFSESDGRQLWEQSVGWIEGKGDHGKAMSRPAIVGDRIFVRPNVLSLKTGEILPLTMPGGGCGTYACTSDALFFRSGTVTVWDNSSGKSTSFPRLRPDCWLSTIPADGMLLSPEGGGGCSCGSWMETSIGFMPIQAH